MWVFTRTVFVFLWLTSLNIIPSSSLCVVADASVHSFWPLSNIPLCLHATSSLSIHQLVDVRALSMICLLLTVRACNSWSWDHEFEPHIGCRGGLKRKSLKKKKRQFLRLMTYISEDWLWNHGYNWELGIDWASVRLVRALTVLAGIINLLGNKGRSVFCIFVTSEPYFVRTASLRISIPLFFWKTPNHNRSLDVIIFLGLWGGLNRPNSSLWLLVTR